MLFGFAIDISTRLYKHLDGIQVVLVNSYVKRGSLMKTLGVDRCVIGFGFIQYFFYSIHIVCFSIISKLQILFRCLIPKFLPLLLFSSHSLALLFCNYLHLLHLLFQLLLSRIKIELLLFLQFMSILWKL